LASKQPTEPVQGKREVPVIHENAVYDLEQARATLWLAKGCLPREIRLGRLRAAKRAGKILITGRWLREWIESGEIHRYRKEPSANGTGEEQG
jgi:hypothetical protein